MSTTVSAIDGAWDFAVKTPTGEQKSVVTLKSEGDKLVGTMDSKDYGVQQIEDGTWNGETLVWKSKVTKPMKLTLTYTATLDENKNLKGFLKVAMAKMQFTGTLIAK